MIMYNDPWYTHRIIYRILDFEVEFTALEPIRIGAGRSSKLESPVDLPVIRIKRGGVESPYIPGSSIKGVFRSSAEFIARLAGLDVCSRGDRCRDTYNEELQGCLDKNDINGVFNLLKNYCLICKLFGSGSYKSHIDFKDAYPITDVTTAVKPGIAISRRSGTVRTGPFFVEYVNPGAKFRGGFTLTNVPNYGVGLLALVIDLVNCGVVKLGGMKTRGFGKVRLDVSRVSVYIFEDGVFREVEEKTLLRSLDDFDSDVEFDPSDPLKYLGGCKEAWKAYVSRAKG